MALIFTNSVITGFDVASSNDTIVTRQDRYVSNDGDAFDFQAFDNVEYFLQGDIFATQDGISADSGANNLSVVVGLGASVNAAGDGIEFLGSATADSGHRVTNDGSIIGESSEGVDIRAQNSQITNNGFISGGGFGAFISGDNSSIFNNGTIIGNSNGAAISGLNSELYNHGSVIGGADGLEVTGDNAQIVNTGDVTGGSIGISMLGTGVVNNTGTVTGDTDGVLFSMSTGEAGTLYNSGTITVLSQSSSSYAFDGSGGDEKVVNSGIIQGDMSFESGNDTLDSRDGEIAGVVFLGDGDDSARLGDGADNAQGDSGDDVIRGRGGDDNLRGNGNNDDIYGGDGDDTLGGGNGDDLVRGGAGEDNVRGGNGEDTIIGGRDSDRLEGGANADTFVFNRNSGSDEIVDFENGTDLIDVSAFSLTFNRLDNAIRNQSGDAVIDWTEFGGDGELRIVGAANDLDATDFIF